MVGISAIMILLNAFASGGSTPTKSNTISSSSNLSISILQLSIKSLMLFLSSFFDEDVKVAGCS